MPQRTRATAITKRKQSVVVSKNEERHWDVRSGYGGGKHSTALCHFNIVKPPGNHTRFGQSTPVTFIPSMFVWQYMCLQHVYNKQGTITPSITRHRHPSCSSVDPANTECILPSHHDPFWMIFSPPTHCRPMSTTMRPTAPPTTALYCRKYTTCCSTILPVTRRCL